MADVLRGPSTQIATLASVRPSKPATPAELDLSEDASCRASGGNAISASMDLKDSQRCPPLLPPYYQSQAVCKLCRRGSSERCRPLAPRNQSSREQTDFHRDPGEMRSSVRQKVRRGRRGGCRPCWLSNTPAVPVTTAACTPMVLPRRLLVVNSPPIPWGDWEKPSTPTPDPEVDAAEPTTPTPAESAPRIGAFPVSECARLRTFPRPCVLTHLLAL